MLTSDKEQYMVQSLEHIRGTVGFIGGRFLPFHRGHIFAIIEASNHVEDLYVVLNSSKEKDDEVCLADGIRPMPAEVRLSWIGESISKLENIHILHIEDESWGESDNWDKGTRAVKKAIGKTITHVFSSEHAYDELFDKYYPEARHIVIDARRSIVTAQSAGEIRRNLYDFWSLLPHTVQSFFVKRIAFIGTESVGKTTLAEKLSKFYNTAYVHEVGRDYTLKYSDQLTVNHFDELAMEHFLLTEKKALVCNRVLLIDSEAIVTQYYLEMYFGSRSGLIDEIIKRQKFDLWLYLEPDLEWIDDGVRFAGAEDVREKNNVHLKEMLAEYGVEFKTISGDYNNRFIEAKKAIDGLFESRKP
jgi:HTH-type transcriptional repressor of NAD biosynthesis genes